MYAYNPISLNALTDLLEYEVFGEKAKFMRQMANSLWILAVGEHFDKRMFRPYTETMSSEIYKNPFGKKSEETGQEIIEKLLKGGD